MGDKNSKKEHAAIAETDKITPLPNAKHRTGKKINRHITLSESDIGQGR